MLKCKSVPDLFARPKCVLTLFFEMKASTRLSVDKFFKIDLWTFMIATEFNRSWFILNLSCVFTHLSYEKDLSAAHDDTGRVRIILTSLLTSVMMPLKATSLDKNVTIDENLQVFGSLLKLCPPVYPSTISAFGHQYHYHSAGQHHQHPFPFQGENFQLE